MAESKPFVEAHMAGFDARLTEHLEEFHIRVDEIFDNADIALVGLMGVKRTPGVRVDGQVALHGQVMNLKDTVMAGWGMPLERNSDGSLASGGPKMTILIDEKYAGPMQAADTEG